MKRGFTLIELLAVLVILAILAITITPVVTGILTTAEDDAYNKQVDNLIKAANTWGLKNIDQLPTDGRKIISLDTLVNDGIIEDNEIINPKTNEKMEGCISVSYITDYKQYEYKYLSDNNLCQ